MSAQGAPVLSRQKIPFKTRRSSTRFTPRDFCGKSGWITDHSKSVRSKRAISSSFASAKESEFGQNRNPFYEYVT